MLLSKGFGNIVIEYAAKFKSKGLLLSTRGCNQLLNAHIHVRDFDSAYRTLGLINFEEDIVRSHGMKIFTDKAVPFDQLEEVINRYTAMGTTYNGHEKQKKVMSYVVNNTTEVTKGMQAAAKKQQELERQNHLNNLNKGINEQNALPKEESKPAFDLNSKIIPEFGINIHSCMALIFNPYVNLVSRNYFSDKKNVSHLTDHSIMYDRYSLHV